MKHKIVERKKRKIVSTYRNRSDLASFGNCSAAVECAGDDDGVAAAAAACMDLQRILSGDCCCMSADKWAAVVAKVFVVDCNDDF